MNQEKIQKRKIMLVGTGFVGMSFAYSLLSEKGIDELVLVDVNADKAKGEQMDLSDGLLYANTKMKITAGSYADAQDTNIVVLTAGAAQKPGQSRLDLVKINANITKGVCEELKKNNFNGLLVVANNPVDIMTYVAWKTSGLPKNHVIGSGTVLDTARLRHALSERLGFADSNIHAYIMGEHGDSSFVPWIHSYIGAKNLLEYLDENDIDLSELQNIYIDVRDKAYKIIDLKRATYYGIGLALKRIVSCILNNERAILPVSSYQNGEYGREGYFIGTPSVVGSNGVEQIVKLPLNENDQQRFNNSFDTLRKTIEDNLGDIL
ncbi:L-lactate dehydrogenase [Faecalicoccus acidiformans]|uniref:L-lactate dehydrogenase n=1 Tax=Faecalicoccus acidiformans TaxID=915173 RepID=A0A7W8D294_9FIRM|nr:L-lactate dehydrogenase [Faecalicoccus acidiformans]MBB5184727.1 L-lactate dehydrogenase [Faecalicoccus acidiformans]MBM6830730.1 L-lactate dehydrogenase [Faecalicoccus acidiformans]MDM8202857.1 L-lactate dehydrogenase [Faecalicoccus acidiformans]HIW18394.1 L-lactate dehydrogenase [Candidatus Faecalicoccus intestinipullorum]